MGPPPPAAVGQCTAADSVVVLGGLGTKLYPTLMEMLMG